MKKEFSPNVSWNSAAVAGLVMGVATIIMDYLPTLALAIGLNGFLGNIFAYLLKLAKIAACIFLFMNLTDRFHKSVETDYAKLQHYGLKVALFSSVLVAGFSLVQILVINPDTIAQMIQAIQETYRNMLDSNSMAAMEKMMSKLPAITFFFSLIYCFLWGWVLSTIFARKRFPVNPFGERTPKSDGTENNDLQ